MSNNNLRFSLADFHFTDNPNILEPPKDFIEWISNPEVQMGWRLFEQQLTSAPKTSTMIKSGIDGKERRIINLTSYNYLGLSTHPEVIQAAREALEIYGLGASGAPFLSGTFDIHKEFEYVSSYFDRNKCVSYLKNEIDNYIYRDI